MCDVAIGSRRGEPSELWHAEDAIVTVEQIAAVIREQLEVTEFGFSDAMRSAAFFLPENTPISDWVAAAKSLGIAENSARNRWREAYKGIHKREKKS